MATKYSDFIKLQSFLPVYDILNESQSPWQSFIPTQQFNVLLQRVLSDITSSDPGKRKSIWVRGTFGTGKSHASAVIKHLLCDESASINPYIDNITDASLKSQIRNLRKDKKYFAVTLKGVEKAYNIPRFTLSLQKAVTEAISAVAPTFVVQSDYKTAIDWINSHRKLFDDYVLAVDEDLKQNVENTDQVLKRLEAFDMSMFLSVEEAVFSHVGNTFQHTGISEWLVEVENKLEEQGIADGLIIFWDEFTSVMDTLKSDRINLLQNIAEKSRDNNVFLYLISHRVEDQSQDTKSKDISKMSDRFDEISYAMDSLSTYLIMRHSYSIPNAESNLQFKNLVNSKLPLFGELFDFLTKNDPQERQYIQNLFPMHPYTAFLCSTISNYIGSSNRSVIKFMHDEDSGFKAFLNDEESLSSNKLLTADSLWDFFYEDFDKDPLCTTFTGIYTSFESKVRAQSEDHLRVFKSILLLNALSPKFKNEIDLLTPDERVLNYLYVGDRISDHLIDILNFLDETKIVSRNVFDQFKITGTSYNQNELANKKLDAESKYKTAANILDYDSDSKDAIGELFKVGSTVRRKTELFIGSCDEQEALIRSRLNKFTMSSPNAMHVAMFFSINESDRDSKMQVLKSFSETYEDLVIVVPEETFSQTNYNKFIDTIATSEVAKMNFNETDSKECKKIAKGFVSKWVKQLLENTYTAFFNGKPYSDGTINQLNILLTKKLSPMVFTKGFETVNYGAVSETFFNDGNCPKVILQIIKAQNRDQIINHKSSASAIRYIFEENGNSLITLSGHLSENANSSNAWIVEVCREMDHCIEEAKKSYADKFSLSDILSSFISKPFGMFTSCANCAAIAYAIRKHKSDLFEPTISQPVSDEKLADMVAELFKMWKNGKSEYSNKLLLRFGSPEESKLTELFVDIFDLNKMDGVNASEIKSLDNVKWYVQEFSKKKAGYPLWTLLYLPEVSEGNKNAIKKMIALFDNDSPSVDKIKELYKLLNLNHMELNLILTNKENYKKGFSAFVESIKEAKIKTEWWSDMLAAVNKLPSEIAFRKESDVRQKIVEFYIMKMNENNSESNNSGNSGGSQQSGGNGPDKTKKTNETSIASAKEKVKGLTLPNMLWQKIALELIDSYPEISEYFNRM